MWYDTVSLPQNLPNNTTLNQTLSKYVVFSLILDSVTEAQNASLHGCQGTTFGQTSEAGGLQLSYLVGG